MRVEIEQCSQELNSFEELVKKTVNAKAKATLRPRSYACKTNQYCFRVSQLSAAKTSTQGQLIKNPRVKEPKSRPQESKVPALQRFTDNGKTSEQAWKEKKKKEKQEKCN